jgi:tetratricopeptide (TPR) repeat protein
MTSRRTISRLLIPGLTALALLAAGLAGCTGPGDGTPTPDGSPTADPSGSPEADETPAPTATPASTRTPAPTPTVDAAESIGYYSQAHSLLNIGNYADAERRFDQVIKLEPDFARGWDGRGQALMMQGNYDQAMFDFDRAIALKPNLAQAYAHRAMARMALDDVAGARRDALQALEMDTKSVQSHLVMGRVYAEEASYQESFESFNTAIELAPEDAGTWLWRGRFYRDVVGEYSRALSDFTKAIELQPSSATLYVDRALLQMQWVRVADARADLEEALSLSEDPALASIHDQAQDLLDEWNRRYPPQAPNPVT